MSRGWMPSRRRSATRSSGRSPTGSRPGDTGSRCPAAWSCTALRDAGRHICANGAQIFSADVDGLYSGFFDKSLEADVTVFKSTFINAVDDLHVPGQHILNILDQFIFGRILSVFQFVQECLAVLSAVFIQNFEMIEPFESKFLFQAEVIFFILLVGLLIEIFQSGDIEDICFVCFVDIDAFDQPDLRPEVFLCLSFFLFLTLNLFLFFLL